MLELQGAVLLAEEVEQLSLALQQRRVAARGEALGALFRGWISYPCTWSVCELPGVTFRWCSCRCSTHCVRLAVPSHCCNPR